MDPASSGDDSSSQSGSDAEIERRIEAYGRDSNSGSSEDEDEEHEAAPISNFDDLPTDDSEEESDDESGSDYNQKMNSQHSDTESSDDDDVPDEDVPLSERVASRAQMGRRYFAADRDAEDDSGKRQKAQNKRRAIELASERLKQVRKGKHGNQEKEKAKKSSDADAISSDESSIEQETKSKRKKSKHAPTEMSSKRRDFFSRGKPDLNSSGIGVSIGANKYKPRDPRMVSLSGHLDTDLFEKRYSFLHEMQDKEIDNLKKRVNAWKTPGKKGTQKRRKLGLTQGGGSLENDQEELKRLLQERADRKRAQVVRSAKRTVKKKIRDDVASGKRGAYYPKRNELRRMEMEAKFDEIRKQGGDEAVDKAIAKRRKKNVSKSKTLMPSHMS